MILPTLTHGISRCERTITIIAPGGDGYVTANLRCVAVAREILTQSGNGKESCVGGH